VVAVYRSGEETSAELHPLHESEEAQSLGSHSSEEGQRPDPRRNANRHTTTMRTLAWITQRRLHNLVLLFLYFQAKQKVDVLHLQLQNLLYEVMHLQKEISKCLEFKSVFSHIHCVVTNLTVWSVSLSFITAKNSRKFLYMFVYIYIYI
jgi:THO complex subunit 5